MSSHGELPIDVVLPDILKSLETTPSLVLRAPTGAGKTTRVAPAILDRFPGDGAVILLEPRRVAARAAARRIAFERGVRLGDEVGYQVRFDRKASSKTEITAMTYGIFLQKLQQDPFLDGVGAVLLDEFHERSLDADLALAMTRKVQREARPELRLVAMSATLDAAPVARFLAGAPIVESEGRLHPVEIRHRPGRADPAMRRNMLAGIEAEVVSGVVEALRDTAGDVLVFLPGVGEIMRSARALGDRLPTVDIAEIYGDMPSEEQDRVLVRGPRRRVVLATNVAESSLTIDGVTAVVDTGLARVLRFDPSVGIDRLQVVRIALASADQRAGRAGRLEPGLCVRLWSAHEELGLRAAEEPEVRRVDLSRAVLELRAWGEPCARRFEWFEAPSDAAMDAAEDILRDLGALTAAGLTPLGHAMAGLPVPPRIGRLLLEGQRLGCPRHAALAAALLTERDPLRRLPSAPDLPDCPPHPARGRRGASIDEPQNAPEESDILGRVRLLGGFADAPTRTAAAWPELNVGAARNVWKVADDLAARLSGEGQGRRSDRRSGGTRDGARQRDAQTRHTANNDAEQDSALLRALLAAWPDRVAQRRTPGGSAALLCDGRGVRLADESCVRSAALFLCIDLDGSRRTEALVRRASAIEEEWLDPRSVQRRRELRFDAASEAVVAEERRVYRELVLARKDVDVDRQEAGELLAVHAMRTPERALAMNEEPAVSFLARVRSLAAWIPELALPVFDRDDLVDIAREIAAGRRSFAEMRRAPLAEALAARLTRDQKRALTREAPEELRVPSGRSVRLQYETGRAPVLAARIQEMFGLAETPRVAAGRVAVVVHLLAPNGRPQQVTEDLASFWKNTYAQIRKELRARYPKHAWPEDPTRAAPERRPSRR